MATYLYLKHMDTTKVKMEQSLPFKAHSVFETFPFSILINEELKISLIGTALRKVMPDCIGTSLLEHFKLERPLIDLKWSNLLTRTNNVFVFQMLENAEKTARIQNFKLKNIDEKKRMSIDSETLEQFLIRGSLVYLEEWKKLLFLGCPEIPSLKVLVESGLFISDLSTHDFSRDIMMKNVQKQCERKMIEQMALRNFGRLETIESKYEKTSEQNKQKSQIMIPKPLRNIPRQELSTFQIHEVMTFFATFFSLFSAKIHEDVSIFYSQIFELDTITRNTILSPRKLISLIDNTLAAFDHFCKKNQVTKIKTHRGLLGVRGLQPEE